MVTKIQKVAVITNYNIYEKAMHAMNFAKKLNECGCEIVTSVYNKEKVLKFNKYGIRFTFLPTEQVYAYVDGVVVLGGDGTILDCARKAATYDKPIIGVNLGRVGYMAELETGEINLIERIVQGDYEEEYRSMLTVDIINTSGESRMKTYALNDAVVSNGSISRIVDLELSEDGATIATYRSDGIIIATPTGSTAYSMSAGGAVVDPRLNCVCVTPICPHSLSLRPMIFPDSATLNVKNTCQREKMLYVTVDGKSNYELYKGECIQITSSPTKSKFIKLKQCGFQAKLRQKMN